jgi:hypothetical protein
MSATAWKPVTLGTPARAGKLATGWTPAIVEILVTAKNQDNMDANRRDTVLATAETPETTGIQTSSKGFLDPRDNTMAFTVFIKSEYPGPYHAVPYSIINSDPLS